MFDTRIQTLLVDSRSGSYLLCVYPTKSRTCGSAIRGFHCKNAMPLSARSKEEQDQLLLFQPSPEELKAAEDLRTQVEDLPELTAP